MFPEASTQLPARAGRPDVLIHRPEPRAFTLLELLVITAVVSLLAALLLPALASGKSRALATQCTSNLRQWGLAFRMYADDNSDFLPRRGQGVQVLAQIDRPDDWFNSLPRYLASRSFQVLVATGNQPAAHSQSVLICPAASDPGAAYFLPYAMNMNLSPWNLPRATKFEAVVRPASVVAMADAPGPYASTYPSPRPYGIVARHSRRVDLLFLAGQVQSFASNRPELTLTATAVPEPGATVLLAALLGRFWFSRNCGRKR